MMVKAKCRLTSLSAYSQSSSIRSERPSKMPHDVFEEQTWRERIHADKNGQVFLPGVALTSAVVEASQYLGMKVKGKGQATYTKHFRSGMGICANPLLGIHIDHVQGERLFLNADGKKNGSRRVWRTMPVIESWQADAVFDIFDETITEDIFAQHLEAAGRFIGIGRFRPSKGGFKGRFKVESMDWQEIS